MTGTGTTRGRMTGGWRDFRPAIWLAMLGIALFAVLNPPYVGVAVVGAAIGVGVRIERHRRQPAQAGPPGPTRGRGRGRKAKR